MGWGSILAIYLLIWTVTLFTVLPFGIRTAEEAGEDKVKGQADSAPARPMLAKKLLWTTLISAVLMAGVWWLGEAGYLNFMPN